MSTERIEMKMKLTQERYDLKRARTEAEALLDALRAELKISVAIEDLNLDRALEIFNDFYAKWRAIRAYNENIARLEAELYG